MGVHLRGDEVAIEAARVLDKLIVRALLHHFAFLEGNNEIGVSDGRQPAAKA